MNMIFKHDVIANKTLFNQRVKKTHQANKWHCNNPADFPNEMWMVSNHIFHIIIETVDTYKREFYVYFNR